MLELFPKDGEQSPADYRAKSIPDTARPLLSFIPDAGSIFFFAAGHCFAC